MYSPLIQARNGYYFLLAFYVFVYSMAYIIYNRDHIYKVWFIFRENDFMENTYVISISVLFLIDCIPISIIKNLPGRNEVYLHHFLIGGVGIWCFIENIGFLFLIFGGLQEASNLTYMGRVYLKQTSKMRFYAHLAHCIVFIFFRFILQYTLVALTVFYWKVPVCYKPICIAMDVSFLGITLLSIRWAYLDLKKLRSLNEARKNANKGYSIQNTEEGKEEDKEENEEKDKRAYIFPVVIITVSILILVAIPLVLFNLSSGDMHPPESL